MNAELTKTAQHQRTRAVFSTEDFELLRTAITHYLKEVEDKPKQVKYANLFHRLNRL
mgnify:CR=1 FL=1